MTPTSWKTKNRGNLNSLTGEFFNVNLKYAQILGHTLETIKHTDRIQTTHPDDLQEYLNNVALLLAGKISEFKTVSRIIRPDGATVWIDLSVSAINYRDYGPCHLCMIEDTTEKRQMVEKLQALTTHLQTVREEERTSISREIHDELGSILTVIKMELEWFAKKLTLPRYMRESWQRTNYPVKPWESRAESHAIYAPMYSITSDLMAPSNG